MSKIQFLKSRLAKQQLGIFSLPFWVLAVIALIVGPAMNAPAATVILFPVFISVAIITAIEAVFAELQMIGTRGTPTTPCPSCGQMRYTPPAPKQKTPKLPENTTVPTTDPAAQQQKDDQDFDNDPTEPVA